MKKIPKYKKVNVEIGDQEIVDEGMAINWALSNLGHLPTALESLKLPTDAGSAIVIDFLLKNSATSKEITRCVLGLRKWIKSQIAPELKKYLSFKQYSVLRTIHSTDEIEVVKWIFIFWI